ncbi:hypothetical protein K402DRAFT_246375 [Aulographum hederae CBS 113979]|uniref:Uncharacterized protein n=1 Tax=Aulographum hederae CBS 113979 TaxID=1176131 RepID=A0A6G1HAH2_9PEZI|nr:hypothetical protein K402DRAFT_246375 [Aulographum hederae CBS 113979]
MVAGLCQQASKRRDGMQLKNVPTSLETRHRVFLLMRIVRHLPNLVFVAFRNSEPIVLNLAALDLPRFLSRCWICDTRFATHVFIIHTVFDLRTLLRCNDRDRFRAITLSHGYVRPLTVRLEHHDTLNQGWLAIRVVALGLADEVGGDGCREPGAEIAEEDAGGAVGASEMDLVLEEAHGEDSLVGWIEKLLCWLLGSLGF